MNLPPNFRAALQTFSLICALAGTALAADAPDPVLVTQWGHNNTIGALAFSPDGKTLASTGDEGTVKLWNVYNGDLRATQEMGGPCTTVSGFAPDGTWLYAAGGSLIRILQSNGNRLRTLQLPAGPLPAYTSACLAPDGRTLAAIADDRRLYLWDTATGQLLRQFSGHTGLIKALAFSVDGALLAAAGQKTLWLWHTKTGRPAGTLATPMAQVTTLAFSPGGQWLSAGGSGGTVTHWSLTTGKPLPTPFKAAAGLKQLLYSPDGGRLFSLSEGHALQVWPAPGLVTPQEPVSPVPVATSPLGLQYPSAMAFSPDGTTLAVGDISGNIKLGGSQTLKAYKTLPGATTHAGQTLAISPDGRWLAVGVEAGDGIVPNLGAVQLWDLQRMSLVRTLRQFYEAVDEVQFAPDGRTMLCLSRGGGQLAAIETATGRTLWQDKIAGSGLRLAPDGKTLTLSESDGSFRTLQTSSGKVLRRGQLHLDPAQFVPLNNLSGVEPRQVSPLAGVPQRELIGWAGTLADGTPLTVSEKADKTAWSASLGIWEAGTGRLVRLVPLARVAFATPEGGSMIAANQNQMKQRFVTRCEVLPDGATVAIALRGQLQLRQGRDGALRALLAGATPPDPADVNFGRFALTRDGKQLLTAGGALWDTKAQKRLRNLPLTFNRRNGTTVALWQRGSKLLAASLDDDRGFITLWDTTANRPVATLRSWLTGTTQHWLSSSPAGYYQGPPGVENDIRWRLGDTLWNGARYQRRFNKLEGLVGGF